MDQRINMFFCFKLGKSAKETHGMLKEVYKDEAITSSSLSVSGKGEPAWKSLERLKTMLIAFFDSKGLHSQRIPP
ncbi:hypothetical protein TNCT_273521 [Trichonephila clavata]|uniref:Mos1 transposase HTH domain-containing protein n=1 Tax=Trichonephila clavata TaxID=2740835 RepID=A0A8X6F1J0_TRICU|nr:hypothetical protein TNCT_273521 [Trichonephila clavata]